MRTLKKPKIPNSEFSLKNFTRIQNFKLSFYKPFIIFDQKHSKWIKEEREILDPMKNPDKFQVSNCQERGKKWAQKQVGGIFQYILKIFSTLKFFTFFCKNKGAYE
jgi:hypothetical protein